MARSPWMMLLALLAFVPLPLCSARAAAPLMDWSGVARRVIPAVVNITVAKIGPAPMQGGLGIRESFSGSGFIIDPAGDIVTNKHVVAGAFHITVTLHDGTQLPARLVSAASMIDIAVLKIDAGRPLPYLRLANDDAVAVGDPVLAVGNPLGIGTSVSSGIVSAVNRNLRNSPFDDYIQTDAAINHGNSGGPLVDAAGQVVGVDTILLTNLKNEGSNGLGFAISSTVVDYVVRHLENPASAPVGWIGAHVQDVTTGLADAFNMPRRLGCIITALDPDSPAVQAGLRLGDVILRYNGRVVLNARAFMREVAITPIGARALLQAWQSGGEKTVELAVRAWPNLTEPRGAVLADANVERPVRPPDLGLLLAPLTPVARRQYGLDGINGVLVVGVDQQSEAFGDEVKPGEVVQQVDDTPVSTPQQVFRLARRSEQTRGVVALLVLWRNGPHWIVLHPGGMWPRVNAMASSRGHSVRP